jgi:hypothetical protein
LKYDGGYTLVKDAVRELKLSRKEVFQPLENVQVHVPGYLSPGGLEPATRGRN